MAKQADQWMSAHDALELLATCLGREKACRQLKEWASLGVIPSKAEMLWERRWREREVFESRKAIPSYFWNAPIRREDWSLGNFESGPTQVTMSPTGARVVHECYFRAYNVEFECSDMLSLLPQHLRPKKTKAGAPERYNWASASAEVLRRFEKSGAIPTRKSDVEAALRDVLASHDKHPAKDTIQRNAAPLWDRLKKADN